MIIIIHQRTDNLRGLLIGVNKQQNWDKRKKN